TVHGVDSRPIFPLPMNLTSVGTSRCDVPARESAGGIVAPLNAARTAQRAVHTRIRGSMREVLFRGNLSMNRPSPGLRPPSPRLAGRGQGEGRPEEVHGPNSRPNFGSVRSP